MALFISCLLYYFYYFFWLSSLLHLHFHCIYVLSISAIVLGIGFKPIILAFVMNIALVSSWCTLYFFCHSNTISWFCSLLLHFSLLSYSFIYFVYLGNLGKLLEKKKKQKKRGVPHSLYFTAWDLRCIGLIAPTHCLYFRL